MDNNTIFHIVNMLISGMAVLVAFLSFRDSHTKDQKDEILRQIHELQVKAQECDVNYKVLEERLNNTISLLNKLDKTLDDIN